MRSAVVGTNYSSRLRAHSYAHARRRASRSLPELRLQNHSQPQHPAPRQPPPRQSASPQPGKISSKALVLLLPPVLLSPLAQLRAPPFAAIAPPSPAKPAAPGLRVRGDAHPPRAWVFGSVSFFIKKPPFYSDGRPGGRSPGPLGDGRHLVRRGGRRSRRGPLGPSQVRPRAPAQPKPRQASGTGPLPVQLGAGLERSPAPGSGRGQRAEGRRRG